MAGFTFKSEYFTTPVKLVLPGIVISMIGLFVNNYFVNNPEKIRGRNSRTAWDNLIQYEKIYSEFYSDIICEYGGKFDDEFVDDLLHIQEMTSENLKTLRDDKDIDKQMAAILNLRLDTYAKLKNVSKTFFDSIFIMKDKISSNDNTALDGEAKLSTKYSKAILRIYYRDTSIIKVLGAELVKKYSTFKSVNFSLSPSADQESFRENLPGRWSFLLTDQSVKFEKNGTGIWMSDTTGHSFAWTLDSTKLNIHFEDRSLEDLELYLISCTKKNMQFFFMNNNIGNGQACRIGDAEPPH